MCGYGVYRRNDGVKYMGEWADDHQVMHRFFDICQLSNIGLSVNNAFFLLHNIINSSVEKDSGWMVKKSTTRRI